jgi:hypothetical protein
MFKDLDLAKARAKANQEKKADDYDKIINEAISMYEKSINETDEVLLKKAADKFLEALTLKQSRMEPYLFLAMIFLIFKKNEKAKVYLGAAEELAPDQPEYTEMLAQVKKLVYIYMA